MKRLRWTLALCSVFVLFFTASSEAVISRNKNIAVFIGDIGQTFFTSGGAAENTIRGILLQNGFKIVNEAQMEKIKRSVDTRKIIGGNKNLIKSFTKNYHVGQVVVGQATVHKPRLNEFNMYTGTAVVSLNAYDANAQYVAASSVTGKEVGYSEDEAAHKALIAAAQQAAVQLIAGNGTGQAAASSQICALSISNVGSFNGANEILVALKGMPGVADVKMSGYGAGNASFEISGSVSVTEAAQYLINRFPNLRLGVVNGAMAQMSF